MFRKDTVVLERTFVPSGTVLIEEGEYGSNAYIIQSGEVRVYTTHQEKEVELSTLGAGQIIGEMALIFDGPRTASVEATEDCNLIVITRQQFQEKLSATDATIRAVTYMLGKRIIESNNSLVSRQTSVDELSDTARIIYQNVLLSLPENRKREFQSNVLPCLDSFLEAIRNFNYQKSK